jgi:hypothetical protein
MNRTCCSPVITTVRNGYAPEPFEQRVLVGTRALLTETVSTVTGVVDIAQKAVIKARANKGAGFSRKLCYRRWLLGKTAFRY